MQRRDGRGWTRVVEGEGERERREREREGVGVSALAREWLSLFGA